MSPGTRVYWYETDRVELFKYKYGHSTEKPTSKKYAGTIITGPTLKDKSWVCLVAEDSNGKVREFPATKLYVFMRELPL